MPGFTPKGDVLAANSLVLHLCAHLVVLFLLLWGFLLLILLILLILVLQSGRQRILVHGEP